MQNSIFRFSLYGGFHDFYRTQKTNQYNCCCTDLFFFNKYSSGRSCRSDSARTRQLCRNGYPGNCHHTGKHCTGNHNTDNFSAGEYNRAGWVRTNKYTGARRHDAG